MIEKLKAARRKLESRKPFSDDVKSIFYDMDLLDLVYTDLKLDGSNLTKEGIIEILGGGYVSNVELSDHRSIQCHKDIMKEFYDMTEIDIDLDLKYLKKLHSIQTGRDTDYIRTKNLMLPHLDYTPVDYRYIEDEIQDMFVRMFKADFSDDPVREAVFVHNELIRIYPFSEGSEITARIAMQYILFRKLHETVRISIGESAYNNLLMQTLIDSKAEAIYEEVLASLIDKTEKQIQIIDDYDY